VWGEVIHAGTTELPLGISKCINYLKITSLLQFHSYNITALALGMQRGEEMERKNVQNFPHCILE
jgi:hypothetical protein